MPNITTNHAITYTNNIFYMYIFTGLTFALQSCISFQGLFISLHNSTE